MNQYKPGILRKPTPDEAEPFIAAGPDVLAASKAATPARPETQELNTPIARRLAELKSDNDSLRARLERLEAGNDTTEPTS